MRRSLALIASTLLIASPVLAASPAVADPIGQCTATRGTIVAVDFAHWGGPLVRGCGVHSPSGYQLLQDGGFTTAGTRNDGPAFMCRIGNQAFHSGTQYPTPNDEACNTTPPASAYWSYWLAPKGQRTWSYTQLGATSDVPKQGEVELWQFGATNNSGTEGQPTVTPDQLRAHNTSPTSAAPTTHSSSRHTSAAPPAPPTPRTSTTVGTHAASSTRSARADTRPASAAATSSRSHPAGTTAHASPSRSRSTKRSSGSSTTFASSPAAASAAASSDPSTGPAIIDSQPAATKQQPSGSALPLVVTLLVALILAGGAGWTVLRRRRAE